MAFIPATWEIPYLFMPGLIYLVFIFLIQKNLAWHYQVRPLSAIKAGLFQVHLAIPICCTFYDAKEGLGYIRGMDKQVLAIDAGSVLYNGLLILGQWNSLPRKGVGLQL